MKALKDNEINAISGSGGWLGVQSNLACDERCLKKMDNADSKLETGDESIYD